MSPFDQAEVEVQWLDIAVSLAAAGDFILAAVSCIWLWGYARETGIASRRAGAMALCLVCGAMASEAVLFLSQAPFRPDTSWTRVLATVVVRGVLLMAAATIAALVWRGASRRRRG